MDSPGLCRSPEASAVPPGGWETAAGERQISHTERVGIEFIKWVMEGKEKGKRGKGKNRDGGQGEQQLPFQKRDRERAQAGGSSTSPNTQTHGSVKEISP